MNTLIVVAGQSNAGVWHVTAADLPPGAFMLSDRVQVWTANGFVPLQPGVNTGLPNYPDSWGPEVGYAAAWLSRNPGDTLYVVKSAKGSTSLVEGAAPNWSPEQPPNPDGSPNGMFNKTTALIAAAKAAISLPVSKVLWMQGEQDATDAAAAQAYAHNLADLFAHMRSAWGADDVVFGQISSRSALAFGDAVRQAQVSVAEAETRALLVSLDALDLQADSLHLTPASALALGRAFFVAGELQDLLSEYRVAARVQPCLAAVA